MSRNAWRRLTGFWRRPESARLLQAARLAGSRTRRFAGGTLSCGDLDTRARLARRAGGNLGSRRRTRAERRRARARGGLRCRRAGLLPGRGRCGRARRRALAGGRRRSCGTLGSPPASESSAAFRRGREQRAAFLERERLGVAVLRYLGVLLAIGDVRSVAAVQHLDTLGREVLDDAIGIRFLLQAYHLARPLERHGIRVVLLQRGVLAAVLHVRTETPDVGDDRLALRRLPERARQLEQLYRVRERERIHLLPRAQTCETRLLLIVLGADLYERAVAAHAHGDGLAGGGVVAEPARLRNLLARDGLLDLLDLANEGLPELVERRGPVFLAARHRIQLVFHRRGEAVLHVAMEVMREEATDDLADVGRHEAPAVHFDVFAILQRRDDGRIGRRPADAVLLQRLHQ